MGSWAYCGHPGCYQGLDKPTGREVIDGEQLCRDGHANTPHMTRDDLILDMVERVEELETQIARCAQKAW